MHRLMDIAADEADQGKRVTYKIASLSETLSPTPFRHPQIRASKLGACSTPQIIKEQKNPSNQHGMQILHDA